MLAVGTNFSLSFIMMCKHEAGTLVFIYLPTPVLFLAYFVRYHQVQIVFDDCRLTFTTRTDNCCCRIWRRRVFRADRVQSMIRSLDGSYQLRSLGLRLPPRNLCHGNIIVWCRRSGSRQHNRCFKASKTAFIFRVSLFGIDIDRFLVIS